MNEFSVYQWFIGDERHEEVKRSVSAVEAVNTAIDLARSVGGRLGTTQRVIVTDGWDNCCWEWKHGEGIIFPTEFAGRLK